MLGVTIFAEVQENLPSLAFGVIEGRMIPVVYELKSAMRSLLLDFLVPRIDFIHR
jgi:hypothetical protein